MSKKRFISQCLWVLLVGEIFKHWPQRISRYNIELERMDDNGIWMEGMDDNGIWMKE
jgi:hypothetical protein